VNSRLAALVAVLTLLVGAVIADAQQSGNVPRIGWLGFPTREAARAYVQVFQQGLKDLGWVEGRNITIEWRFADGKPEHLPALMAELIQLRVDMIVVPSTPPSLIAKQATTSIPIVTVGGGDPVELGLAASLARPGGNVTGLTSTMGPEIAGKQLEVLKETVPKVSRMAVLWNPATPGNALALKEAEIAARTLGVQLERVEARRLGDLDGVFREMSKKHAGSLLILGDVLFTTHRARLADLTVKNRLPALYGDRQFAEAGGLASYGVNILTNFYRAATYVDKILKGAKPSDLPVEQPTKFSLVINFKTAKALGLTVPSSLLLRADHIIQ